MAPDLSRFEEAQEPVYPQVLAELKAGRKETHWMWYIFPQIRGLGTSPQAERYALRDLAEARAYLDHEILGARLAACAQALLAHSGRSARSILGTPDDLKLRSSMTLFVAARPGHPQTRVFQSVLKSFFDNQPDLRTLQLLEESGPTPSPSIPP